MITVAITPERLACAYALGLKDAPKFSDYADTTLSDESLHECLWRDRLQDPESGGAVSIPDPENNDADAFRLLHRFSLHIDQRPGRQIAVQPPHFEHVITLNGALPRAELRRAIVLCVAAMWRNHCHKRPVQGGLGAVCGCANECPFK